MQTTSSPTIACEKAVAPIKKWYPSAEGALICMNAKGEYIVYMDCDLVEVNYLKYIDEMIQKVKVNQVWELKTLLALHFLNYEEEN